MARLPQIGGDDGSWGEILNDFLSQSLASDGSIKPGAIDKNTVGLGNVDNTSDEDKPISSAMLAALDEKVNSDDLGSAATLDASQFATAAQGTLADGAVQSIVAGDNISIDSTDPANPIVNAVAGGGGTVNSVNGQTGVVVLTKSDVGLGNVDNTSDANKPISTATQTALDVKVDKVAGRQLSTEDYSTLEKTKLAGIAAGAEVNVNADWNSVSGDSQILNKPALGTAASANTTAFATAAQGATADTAVQPDELDTAVTQATTSAINTHSSDTTNVHGIADTSLLVTTASGATPSEGEVLTWSDNDGAYLPVARPSFLLLETNETTPPADTPIGTIIYRKA